MSGGGIAVGLKPSSNSIVIVGGGRVQTLDGARGRHVTAAVGFVVVGGGEGTGVVERTRVTGVGVEFPRTGPWAGDGAVSGPSGCRCCGRLLVSSHERGAGRRVFPAGPRRGVSFQIGGGGVDAGAHVA